MATPSVTACCQVARSAVWTARAAPEWALARLQDVQPLTAVAAATPASEMATITSMRLRPVPGSGVDVLMGGVLWLGVTLLACHRQSGRGVDPGRQICNRKVLKR